MSLDRALKAAAFDMEADRPRSGWTDGDGGGGIEVWTREAAGIVAAVVGSFAQGDRGGGCWRFTVAREGEVITSGESSRRGWAMDGADSAIPTVN